jgi:hypothetical protein
MKDQYVGDISDYEKYALLRAFSAAADLPLAICWMLTAPDATGQGNRIDYLSDPSTYQHLDPHVFDKLAAIVTSGNRSVRALKEAGVLERATFFERTLEDHASSRIVFFRELWQTFTEPALLFFDPDIGIAGVNGVPAGRRPSMYVFDHELAEGYRRGHSLVVFDHWRRVQRLPYLEEMLERLRRATGANDAFAVWGTERVVFFVVPQDDSAQLLENAGFAFARRWPDLDFTN